MAIRRRGALAGLGEGIAGVGKLMLGQQTAEEGSRRIFTRQILNDYEDKVTKGELEPEQATAALRTYGINVDPTHFQQVAPTIERKLQGIVQGFGKATNPGEIPSDTELAQMAPPKATRVALGTKFSPSEEANTGPTLPSQQMQPTSLPSFQNVLNSAEAARNRFAPVRVEGTNAEGLKTEEFVSSNPRTLTGRTFAKEPTPEQGVGLKRRELEARTSQGVDVLEGRQKGTVEGESALTKQRTENIGGMPGLKASAFNTESDLTRRTRARDAYATSRASAQATSDVHTDPATVQKEIAAKIATDDAVEKFKAGLVPEGLARSFMHAGPITKTPYVFMDPGTPQEIRRRVQMIASDPKNGFGQEGIRFLNKQQNEALLQIDQAVGALDTMLNEFKPYAAKSAGGRAIQIPANALAKYLQTHPQLASVEAFYGPMIEIFRATTAGVSGFRMTQYELQKAAHAIPEPGKDTWETMLRKAAIHKETFENLEKRIIGLYDTPQQRR